MSELRAKLIAAARAMRPAGLNRGTAGNLSVRCGDGFLITPTGMPYDALEADDVPLMAIDDSADGNFSGRRKPSSEWRFHRDLYASRPEVGAVLHAHSPFAVTLACLRRAIPPFHYMIARFGGDTVRCADYALFGTPALSAAALAAMADRRGCLLANHGLLVAGRDLDDAVGCHDPGLFAYCQLPGSGKGVEGNVERVAVNRKDLARLEGQVDQLALLSDEHLPGIDVDGDPLRALQFGYPHGVLLGFLEKERPGRGCPWAPEGALTFFSVFTRESASGPGREWRWGRC